MKVCSKCHIGKPVDCFHKDKSKKDGICPACKKCVSARQEAYYQGNREKSCRRVREYYANHKERRREYDAEYRRENQDRIRDTIKSYRKRNPDKVKQWDTSQRERDADKINKRRKIFRENNKERIRLQLKKHYEQHKDKFKIRQHNRSAKKRAYNSDKITLDVINSIMSQQDNKCYYCKEKLENYHIEHIIPLIKGGDHKEYNIVLSCPTCNLSKGAKMPDVFLSQNRKNNENQRARPS